MPDPRYRAVTTMLGSRVFFGNDVIATCPSAEWAEHIAESLNLWDAMERAEMEDPSDGDG